AALLGGATLFLLGGLVPHLAVTEWPAMLRVYHTIEIFFQNAPAGMLIAWLGTRRVEETAFGRDRGRAPAAAAAPRWSRGLGREAAAAVPRVPAFASGEATSIAAGSGQ